MITEESRSDFDTEKKAAYYDQEGYELADEQNKHKLKTPKAISDLCVE